MADFDTIANILDAIAEEGAIPSLSIAVLSQGRLVLHHTTGLARIDPPKRVFLDQPYDLASLTKPLAGILALAALLQRGELSLDDPVARWLPHVDPQMTVRHLCQHTSGLPAWAPLHEGVPRADWGSQAARSAILDTASRVPLLAVPGRLHRYSDLGFLVLLDIIERLGRARLDDQLLPWFEATCDGRLRWGWPGAAATEVRPDRGGVIEGVVHDPIAYAMGGVSAHAGLFGTARAVALLCDAWLDAVCGRDSPLPAAGLRQLWEDPGVGSHRGGLDTPTEGGSTGRFWPSDGRGHLGYTGTSVWMAPYHRVVVVLLTNRIHPIDDVTAIRAARPRIHEAVARVFRWDRGHRA